MLDKKEYMDALLQGEPLAFENLVKRYHSSVYRFFVNRGIKAPDVVAELTQETFLYVHRGLQSFRGDASIDQWIYAIARNICRNEFRRNEAAKRKAREVPIDGTGDDIDENLMAHLTDSAPTPEERVLQREEFAAVREAIANLPPQMRRCIQMYAFRQMKFEEISKALDISVQAVKSHISQARRRLHFMLHRTEHD